MTTLVDCLIEIEGVLPNDIYVEASVMIGYNNFIMVKVLYLDANVIRVAVLTFKMQKKPDIQSMSFKNKQPTTQGQALDTLRLEVEFYDLILHRRGNKCKVSTKVTQPKQVTICKF